MSESKDDNNKLVSEGWNLGTTDENPVVRALGYFVAIFFIIVLSGLGLYCLLFP